MLKFLGGSKKKKSSKQSNQEDARDDTVSIAASSSVSYSPSDTEHYTADKTFTVTTPTSVAKSESNSRPTSAPPATRYSSQQPPSDVTAHSKSTLPSLTEQPHSINSTNPPTSYITTPLRVAATQQDRSSVSSSKSAPNSPQLSDRARSTEQLGEEESEDDISSYGFDTALGDEKKKKKKGKFGLKIPKAIRSYASGSSSKTADEEKVSFRAVDIHRQTLKAEELLSELEILRNENHRLRNSNEEITSFLEAKSFTLEQMRKARDDEEKAYKQELNALVEQLELSKKSLEAFKLGARENSNVNSQVVIDELIAKNRYLQDKAAELDLTVIKSNNVINELKIETKSLTRHIEQLTREKSIMEQELQGNQSSMDERVERLTKENEELFVKNNLLQKEQGVLQFTLSTLQQNVASLETDKAHLLNEKRKAEQDEALLSTSYAHLQEEARTFQEDIVLLKELEIQYNQERTRLQSQLENIEKEKNTLESDTLEMQKELNRIRDEKICDEEGRTAEFTAEAKRMKAETEQLSLDLLKTNKEKTELLTVISEYRTSNDRLKEDLTKTREDVTALQEELSRIKVEAETKASEQVPNAQALEKVRQLEIEAYSTAEELSRLKKEIARLGEVEKTLAKERDHFKRESISVSQQIVTLQDSLLQNKANLSDEEALAERVAQLEADKVGLISNLEAAKKAEEDAEVSRIKAIANYQTASIKLENLEKELGEVQIENQRLREAVREKEREADEKERQIERAREKESAVSKQLQELTGKLKDAETLKDDKSLELISVKADYEASIEISERRLKEIQELKQEIEKIEKQTKEVKHSTLESSAEIDRLQATIRRKETEWSSKLRTLQADTDAYTARLRMSNAEVQSLRAELQTAKKDVTTKKDELEKLTNGEHIYGLLHTERQELVRHAGDLDGELQLLRQSLATGENDLKQMTALNDKLKKDNDSLEYRLQEVSSRMNGLQQSSLSDRTSLQERAAQAEKEALAVRGECQDLRLEISALTTQLKSLEMERDVSKASISSLKTQIKSMDDSSTTLTNNLNAKELELEKQIRELQKQNELKVLQIQTVTERESHSRNELKLKIEELDELKSLNDVLSVRTRGEISELEAKISNFETKCLELECQNRRLQSSGSSLLPDTLKSTNEWHSEADGYRSTVKSLETAIQALEEKNKTLISQLETITSCQSENEAIRKMLESQISSLEEQLCKSQKVSSLLPSFGKEADMSNLRRKEEVRNLSTESETSSSDKKCMGILLSNSLVSGRDIPTRVVLLEKSSSDNVKTSARREAAVVSILKSRLIECLFDRSTPGEPNLPSSLFGYSIPPENHKWGDRERPMVARVLSRVQNLWELGEDLRLALVQGDTDLSNRYLESKTTLGDWMQTMENLRGSAQILEERNKKLESLCNSYLYATKEARAAAQLEREKCKTLSANFKKRLQAILDSKEVLLKENAKISEDLLKLKSGLDLTIEENRHLQQGNAKYLTTLPYVKNTIDDLKEQMSRLHRNTEALPQTSQSVPRERTVNKLSLDDESPHALTTGARYRQAPIGGVFKTTLSEHPNFCNNGTPIQQLSSRMPLSDRFLVTPGGCPAVRAHIRQGGAVGEFKANVATPLSMTTIPLSTRLGDETLRSSGRVPTTVESSHGRWPTYSSVTLAPATISTTPSLSFASKSIVPWSSVTSGKHGTVGGASSVTTRSVSPLRLSPLNEMEVNA